ncbi:uncharacterized protein At1g76070 isoform X2 [Ananas comosus]|uniref:Uncharacterized protein At1g76070 isoform X2 n=1 Tax=Ananas comosus TaxID=4615 RepID=A0A6P5F9N7_ANACO|nr:uncharacterized protein At1g76070 isoform X2 [Ananas comosus]
MEKAAGDHHRSKNSGFLRFLAKSTSFSIPRHHLYNPPRERSYFNKAFSGPIVSIIPAEARYKEERSTVDGEEPLSPKVSCIGRIKGKKRSSEPKRPPPSSVQQQQQQQQKKKKKKQHAYFSFRGKAVEERADEKGRRSGAAVEGGGGAPRIGEMRRFASGRETIADFDWKKGESSAYDDHEVIIAYSAPLTVGGADWAVAPEPRKEVNIWKRRTMAPPRPLQV